MREVTFSTPLYEVLGAKSAFLKRLSRLGLNNVRDLLSHFPTRYEDFSKIYRIAELEPGQQATVQGIVEEVHLGRSWRKQMTIVEAVIADTSGSIRAVWFNQPYIANILKVGREANLSGKTSLSDENELYLSNPTYELLGAGKNTKHTARLVPVYPETRGLTSRGLRFIIQSVLKHTSKFDEWIPEETLKSLLLPELNEAIRSIHLPDTLEEAVAAQKRFSFEDLFLLQLLNYQRKLSLAAEKAPTIPTDLEFIKDILGALPFELTTSQKKALWEIVKDMAKVKPMSRLLQGDVGSGKTVIAAITALLTAENNYQAAFMAPTEILAQQHFETMRRVFGPMHEIMKGRPIGFVASGGAMIAYEDGVSARITKPAMMKKIASGEVTIIFGTHALIQKKVAFKNLGLVIVDEQHRFGVRQRAELAKKKGGRMPHFLSMSATPIPRTLMLTVFGDLDLSLITELPGGRRPIETKIVAPQGRAAMYEFVKSEVAAGRQVFVICPRIEKPEETDEKILATLDMKSVKEEYERLRTKIFPDLRLAMLHGQMKPTEKEEIMQRFTAGDFDILVSTSVVEVGVDIPNASVMLIEGTDRFGLAQLYQFRGRVGRGSHQSYCFLMADSDAKAANVRLKAVTEARNGFELAEKDLALRGPGQFFGEVQTGLPDIAMRALQDPTLVGASREAARAVTEADPTFKAHPALKARVSEFQKRLHSE